MTEYFFTRAKIGNLWDVNHPDRVDIEINTGYLAQEVETALPGKNFTLHCNATEIKFIFENSLDLADQAILSTVVDNHKSNV